MGLVFFFIEYGIVNDIDTLIECVTEEMVDEWIDTLFLSTQIENLYDLVADFDFPRDEPNVLFIKGLEKSIEDDKLPIKVLEHLNLYRETFRRDFSNTRFVFLLPKNALNLLILYAQDFFDFRSGVIWSELEDGVKRLESIGV